MSFEINRTTVMLSLQRALLGEVFPSLRMLTVEWTCDRVFFYAYVDGAISENDSESLSCISAEVAADYWDDIEIDYEAIRIDYPAKITDSRTRVYHRRE